MKLNNLTPHDIVLNGKTIKSGGVARAQEVKMARGTEKSVGVPVYGVAYEGVTGLPEPQQGAGYIVSIITAQAAAALGRKKDIYYPGELIRDESGRVIGCAALYQIA